MDVTELLNRWSGGDAAALDQLITLVYGEMKGIAHGLLRQERPGQMLNTTSLVHEAYLRLVDQERMAWSGKRHFLGAAAMAMRRILVDQARQRLAAKRGRGAVHESLDFAVTISLQPDLDVIRVSEALDEFKAIDPARAEIVELRYFAGLSLEETAELLQVSPQRISRDWTAARAWLARRLRERPA